MSDYADNLRKSMINKTRRFMRMVQELKEKDAAALREQVIRMAREADLHLYGDAQETGIERFFLAAAAAGAAAEREAIIDLVAFHGGSVEIEAAIRARGEK